MENNILGVSVGRFGPVHLGHVRVGNMMIENHGSKNSLIVIGSSNNPPSLRHFFSYLERRKYLQILFPDIKLFGIPDYPNDEIWLTALDDCIKAIGFDPLKAVYWGGCEEDVSFFINAGRNVKIINRFEKADLKISATEVRDCLIRQKSISHLVHPLIEDELKKDFAKKWKEFEKM